MNIREKVREVEKVFSELEKDIKLFQSETQLGCKTGCGECCKKPDIEATVLEFLPLAFYLWQTGKDAEVLRRLEETMLAPPCTFFSSFFTGQSVGMCSIYLHRGLICRLFGFSASRDKEGKPVLATCKFIKTELSEKYNETVRAINEGAFVPVMNQYYMKLLAIDLDLGNRFFPINQAIKLAVEKVSLSCMYEAQEAF